ncbi:MAG: rod shape-determining protein RodA [Acidobacteriaceae bacterium]|nr:rod shape-determining protein RodA [Acidobacteriaceae bacterium]MBV9295453.1 rod shape-determining protein RodA [Acidobacteriaceae bacterium]MBV9767213.1 rod shape-determining protein RodA [Acidobacteriaceae bacterium]
MPVYRSIRELDWPLLIVTLALCTLGVLQIYSATLGTRWQDAWWKQIVWVVTGIAMMWVIASVDYHSLLGARVIYLYIASLVLLVITGFAGNKVFGSTRWIKIAGFTLQTSEFVKIVLILLMAKSLTDLKTEELNWKDLAKLAGFVAVPMALVMKEPDLGTALTYIPILICGVLMAGMRWKYILVITGILMVSLPIGYHFLKPYQKDRLVSFIYPDRDPKGTGFQVIQSRIAVGNGGMWGRGAKESSQTHLGFLPVPHTDFIFSSFAEEHGFVGIVVALVLYFLLIMQVVQNAQTATDRAGLYICMGVAALLLFHVLVNVGMVVGRMPITGIPLPLMSSGGSNTWSIFLMLGLVNSVRLRRFVN